MDKLNILKTPLVTEKTMAQGMPGRYSFLVTKGATKGQISQAVEAAFGVVVTKVRTVSLKGKRRRSGKHFFEVPDKKKAIVQLAPEQKIDIFEKPAQSGSLSPKKKKKEGKS